MKKFLIFASLFALLFSVSSDCSAFVAADQGAAATILLCTNSLISFKGDVAITSFTETWYENGRFSQTLNINNIQYERIPTSNGYFTYRVSGFDMQDPNQPATDPITNDDGNGGITPGTMISFPIHFNGGINFANSVIGNVVLGVLPRDVVDPIIIPPSGLYNEGVIGIVFALPKWHNLNRRCEISNVVISDLANGAVVATLNKVKMGEENRVVLNKLNDIHKDIKSDISLSKLIYNYVVKIYNIVRSWKPNIR